MRKIARVTIDSAALYTISVFALAVCLLAKSEASYIIAFAVRISPSSLPSLSMLTKYQVSQISCISFNLLITRLEKSLTINQNSETIGPIHWGRLTRTDGATFELRSMHSEEMHENPEFVDKERMGRIPVEISVFHEVVSAPDFSVQSLVAQGQGSRRIQDASRHAIALSAGAQRRELHAGDIGVLQVNGRNNYALLSMYGIMR
jgi:hypothetical protein